MKRNIKKTKEALLTMIDGITLEQQAEELRLLRSKAYKRMKRQLEAGDLKGGALTFDLYRVLERTEVYARKAGAAHIKKAIRMNKKKK